MKLSAAHQLVHQRLLALVKKHAGSVLGARVVVEVNERGETVFLILLPGAKAPH